MTNRAKWIKKSLVKTQASFQNKQHIPCTIGFEIFKIRNEQQLTFWIVIWVMNKKAMIEILGFLLITNDTCSIQCLQFKIVHGGGGAAAFGELFFKLVIRLHSETICWCITDIDSQMVTLVAICVIGVFFFDMYTWHRCSVAIVLCLLLNTFWQDRSAWSTIDRYRWHDDMLLVWSRATFKTTNWFFLSFNRETTHCNTSWWNQRAN